MPKTKKKGGNATNNNNNKNNNNANNKNNSAAKKEPFYKQAANNNKQKKSNSKSDNIADNNIASSLLDEIRKPSTPAPVQFLPGGIPKIQVKVINHLQEERRPGDLQPIHRNLDPVAHPFKEAREYTRALTATKLDKILAKPFLAALEGHGDLISSMCLHPKHLSVVMSGACDGEIRVWDISTSKTLWRIPHAHNGIVKGMVASADGSSFFSCGSDSVIKHWRVDLDSVDGGPNATEPIQEYIGSLPFFSVDHHYSEPIFASGGDQLYVWNEARSRPIHAYNWGSDTIHHVRFNRVERNIVAALSKDRSITLFDIRMGTAIRNVVMRMRSNSLCWNPYVAQNFTVANDDFNLYTYDMRDLSKTLQIYSDHVGPVMDIDYSPTGAEFVTGSWDRTVRIYKTQQSGFYGHSREVYHTRRMQRVEVVKFSLDTQYVLSGSQDHNIRVWKANAAKPVRILSKAEEKKIEYYDQLKQKYKKIYEIRRIADHKIVPRDVFKKQKVLSDIRKAEKRRLHKYQISHRNFQEPDPLTKNIIEEQE